MSIQLSLDRAAIGLSLLCAAHCLLLPVTMIFVSTFIPITLDDEAFHRWLLIAIVPISLVAFVIGCRKHRRYSVYFFGAIGLFLLGLAGYLGHDYLGEIGERLLTVIGGIVLAFCHLGNYQVCPIRARKA